MGAEVSAVHAEQQHWRDQVLTGLGWTAVAASGAVTAALLLFTRDRPGAILWAASAVVFLLAATLRGSGVFRVRVWLLILPLCMSAGVVGPALEGFVPNSSLGLGAAVVFTTALRGLRWGLVVLVLEALMMGGVAVLHHTGALGVLPGYEALAAFPLAVVGRFVTNFTIGSAAMVVAISYLLSRVERLLLDKTRALEQLKEEQGASQRAREDLEFREAAFRKARELEILGRLAGCMAHDFNNALVVVQSNVDLIRAKADYLATGLRQIDEAVAQAASTTRQLRGFTHQAPAPSRPVSLGLAVTRAAALLERVLPTNITMAVDVEDHPTVMADEGQLQGVVTNLALNARDAMPKGGKLELRVRTATPTEGQAGGIQGPCALVEVNDDGLGMSEETMARLFEPYFTTKGAAGTGLGLASVKAAVEAGGGKILVTSAPGRGTHVRILWPVYERGVDGAQTSETTELPLASRPGTVLLVEDNERVRIAMARMLAARGFTVLEAPNGTEALTIARRYRAPIEVLCSDCEMPGISVEELIAAFRLLFPAARVVLCSSYAPEDVAPPLETVDAFVAKPFAPDELARQVGDLVARAQDAAHDAGFGSVESGGPGGSKR
jgi:two-component system, cell cycle sensor histidine kinase and response regulator CckA